MTSGLPPRRDDGDPVSRWTRFLASPVVRSVAILSGATAASQVILVLSSPILTRLFTPEEFGALGVFGTCVLILASVACFRYDLAIPLAESEAEARALSLLAAGIAVAVSLVVGGLATAFSRPFADLVRAPGLSGWMWLLPVAVLGTALQQIAVNRMLRARRLAIVGKGKLVQSLATVTVQIAGGILALGLPGLLLGVALGSYAAVAEIQICSRGWKVGGAPAVAAVPARTVARRFGRFARDSSASALVNTTGLFAPLLLLAAFCGPQVAGWFALCHRVLSLPVQLVGQALSQVFLAEAPALAREDPARLRRLFRRTARSLFLFGAAPLVLFSPLYPVLFPPVFGAGWEEAGWYALWLSPAIAVRFAVSPLSTVLVVLERQGTQLAWDVVRLVLTVACIVGGATAGLAPIHIVGLLGACGALLYAALYVVSARALAGAR